MNVPKLIEADSFFQQHFIGGFPPVTQMYLEGSSKLCYLAKNKKNGLTRNSGSNNLNSPVTHP